MNNLVRLKLKNVLGTALKSWCQETRTGYYRDGFCRVESDDRGNHSVCAVVTAEFLEFSLSRGNDLVTARPEYGFPGLKPGDRWCLCAGRWQEAFEAGLAPPVDLGATSELALEVVRLQDLKARAFELDL